MIDEAVTELSRRVASAFRTFGRDSGSSSFLGKCLTDSETAFSAGVSVRDVVEFTLKAAAELTPGPTPTLDGLDAKLVALGHELRRFDDALSVVADLKARRGEAAEQVRWVADAALAEGTATIRAAIDDTLRDLLALSYGKTLPVDATLGAMLDVAQGDGCRRSLLLAETVLDLRGLGEPSPRRCGGDLRFPSTLDAASGERLVDVARHYVRQARRATLVARNEAGRAERPAECDRMPCR